MESQVLSERYALQKQLRKNAGRRTFLARDLQTQELVAIKILTFGASFQWEDLKLFEREAQTLQMLSHPSIPKYLDYFDVETLQGKGFALVQSYIPEKSLEQWLKSGRSFSDTEVKQLAKALLEILRYLHGQEPPVIHRDIKPSNILLGARSGNSVGQVYLVDFGSVQTLAAKKGSTITVVGTYGYMPPEQFGGRTVPASDIYSLGATLIYLVTGRHPAELSQDNLRIQFESVANLNPELISWLKWMTEPSLNRRLASVGEALNALEHPRERTEILVREPIFGSRIQLKTKGDSIEILIPPARLSFKGITEKNTPDWDLRPLLRVLFFWGVGFLLLGPVFGVGKGLIISVATAILLSNGLFFWGVAFLLFSPLLGIRSSLIIIVALIALLPKGVSSESAKSFLKVQTTSRPSLARFFYSIRIRLNQDKIFWVYEWLWFKRPQPVILRKDMGVVTGQDNTEGEITIFTRQENYQFCVAHLSDPEREWLVNVLRQWSGV